MYERIHIYYLFFAIFFFFWPNDGFPLLAATLTDPFSSSAFRFFVPGVRSLTVCILENSSSYSASEPSASSTISTSSSTEDLAETFRSLYSAISTCVGLDFT
uniref:Putative secreted protein n=1 Tax=Anopheles darlingi TaxID=43151 RepID=A0A2M4D4M6_ANODA